MPVIKPLTWFSIGFVFCVTPALSQNSPGQLPGAIHGVIIDKSGAAIAGAQVNLDRGASAAGVDVLSSADGHFSFPDIAPGPYRIVVSAPGFAGRTVPGVLNSGEVVSLPPIELTLRVVTAGVNVTLTKTELAEAQVKQEEQQQLLGFLPNFRVSYVSDAVPLTAGQKFELAWKSAVNPVSFGITGIVAGIQQKRNDFSGFGQGTAGYAKRYGAAYGNFLTRTMLSEALLPSLFRQDPRYFYKGSGSTKSRIGYAISRSVIRKGDNGKWQPNYSGVLGTLAAGGISNLYYPAKDRNGAGLTFQNALIDIGAEAAANLMQEFLFKKLTPRSRKP